MSTLSASHFNNGNMVLNHFVTQPNYATLATMTKQASAPMIVLNPYSAPFANAMKAFDNGYLNPNQPGYPGSYYSISTAYGREPNQDIYASRGCASSTIKRA